MAEPGALVIFRVSSGGLLLFAGESALFGVPQEMLQEGGEIAQ